MKTGEGGASRQARSARSRGTAHILCALSFVALQAGCTANQANVDKKLMADRDAPRRHDVVELYRVGYPDVLGLSIKGRAELDGLYPIDLTGRIDLGAYGRPRVQGHTPAEIAELVAFHASGEPEEIRVTVAEYKSRRLYLFGQVRGWQRSVPYQGQETVLDVLQRVGGITPGAEPDDVHVVRPHLADGQRPEIFHVHLADIVVKHDYKTNVRVQPDDQIFVGETRQSRLERCVPPWLRPLYHAVWGAMSKPKETVSGDL
jgi:protein involved in polysaccharide export with SLBB domain